MQAIAQLMQGYLHAHYLELYGDPWTAVEAFARTEDEAAPHLCSEIANLLASRPSERRLRKVLTKDLECPYAPDTDGLTYSDWLQSIANRVDEVRSSPTLRQLEEIPRIYIPIGGESKIKGASSVPDVQTAEWAVSTVLDNESSNVDSWLSSTSGGLRLTGEHKEPVGRLMVAETGEVHDVCDVAVILRRSDALNIGYVIEGAYPARLTRAAACAVLRSFLVSTHIRTGMTTTRRCGAPWTISSPMKPTWLAACRATSQICWLTSRRKRRYAMRCWERTTPGTSQSPEAGPIGTGSGRSVNASNVGFCSVRYRLSGLNRIGQRLFQIMSRRADSRVHPTRQPKPGAVRVSDARIIRGRSWTAISRLWSCPPLSWTVEIG